MTQPQSQSQPQSEQLPAPATNSVLIKIAEVVRRTNLSRTTIYAWRGKGKFPAQVRLDGRSVACRLQDIEDWITSRETVDLLKPSE